MHTFDVWAHSAHEEVMRKPRHHRTRNNGNHRITENVIDVLMVLARYRYLRSSHLEALLPNRSADGLRRSLRRLYDHGYIDKPREQLRGYNNLYCSEIYMLDTKGQQLLSDRGLASPLITRLYRDRTDAPIRQFAHAMMICDTLASIEAGAIQAGITFIPWTEIVKDKKGNPLKFPISIVHNHESHNGFLVPDGLFGLDYGDGKIAYFALEAEHYNPIRPTNLKRASTLKKLLGYRDIVRNQVYKHQLGIGNLRVLVVAPNPTRTLHQVELLEELVGKSHLFLFHPIPVQEELYKAPPPFPELFDAPWMRAGLEPEQINGNTLRTSGKSKYDHCSGELRSQA